MTAPRETSIRMLYDGSTIADRVERIAERLAENHTRDRLMVAILKGSFVFAADLMRALMRAGVDADIDFLRLSSYGQGTSSSGTVTVLCDVAAEIADRDVVVIDDILDTGRTLAFAREHLLARGARSVETVALIDKPARRQVRIQADHAGFRCEDVFVVGYGIDMGQRYRGLPFIGHVVEDAPER
ncbi:MAG: hypoxanthine phosphoribosyltransferase [Hyphomicrobiales bacterium]